MGVWQIRLFILSAWFWFWIAVVRQLRSRSLPEQVSPVIPPHCRPLIARRSTWELLFSDPIDFSHQRRFGNLGAGVIGSDVLCSTTRAVTPWFASAMVSDAADEMTMALSDAFPTAAQFSAFVPTSVTPWRKYGSFQS